MSELDQDLNKVGGARWSFGDPDLLLQQLVMAVEHGTGTEMEITLTVSGSLISGLLIGRIRWCRELAISSDTIPEPVKEWQIPWKAISQMAEAHEDERKVWDLSYIHLKNARFFADGQLISPNSNLFWRGRLSQVSGFAVGALSPGQ